MEPNVTQLATHEKLWAWFETHMKETIWGVAVVVVVGLGVGFYFYHQSQRQLEANDALSSVLSRASAESNSSTVPEALSKMAAEYSGTKAAARALLFAGGDLFAKGKYTQAKARFDSFLRQYPDSDFADQALFGAASCLDAMGKTNEASAAYNDIIQHHPNSDIAPEAKFALARLDQAQGKYQHAEDLYRELRQAQLFRSIATESSMQLAELTAKHPAPKTQSAPPAHPALTNLPAMPPSKP